MEGGSRQPPVAHAEPWRLQLGIRIHGKSRSRFGLLLAVILASALFQLAAPEADWAQFVLVALMAGTLVVSLDAARIPLRIRRVVVAGATVIVVGAGIAVLGPGDISEAIPRVLALLFVVLTPVAVVIGLSHQLREDGVVTLQSMFAGLCIYLLIAIAFSFMFGVLDNIGDPFFADGRAGTTSNLLYFSFTTMTTTGYGDFVAATQGGRALAVAEALIGQVYLVTVVALIIANLGRRRAT